MNAGRDSFNSEDKITVEARLVQAPQVVPASHKLILSNGIPFKLTF